MTAPEISFIIPTYNEEEHIKAVIDAIKKRLSDKYLYEIIVVDNGSDDKTVFLAENSHAKIFIKPSLTIAGLRNFGAKKAKGDILIFVDGDVYLADKWIENFPQILEILEEDPYIITGSRCGISKSESWIERFWFKPLLLENANYINSGHLITTKRLFNDLGGFKQGLETGEDYDFSMRAKNVGAKIINNPELQVIHEGYPKNLFSFMRREVWHGKETYKSLNSILTSKTGIISIVFLFLHLISLFGLLFLNSLTVMALSSFLIALICIMSSAVKFRPLTNNWFITSYIYYFYFWGRSLCFVKEYICGKVVLRILRYVKDVLRT